MLRSVTSGEAAFGYTIGNTSPSSITDTSAMTVRNDISATILAIHISRHVYDHSITIGSTVLSSMTGMSAILIQNDVSATILVIVCLCTSTTTTP